MYTSLPETIQQELIHLTAQYGQPITRTYDLASDGNFEPVNKKDRYGEVCMVVRRPNGRLLTMIKTYYPANAYRLLTGGINHDEFVFDALLRETAEETGLEVTVERFLASAAYHLPHTGPNPVFFTFAFLLQEVGGSLETIDEEEQVEDFREIEVSELPAIADRLDQLATTPEYSNTEWGDWGKFRAIMHRLTWESLQN
ncbi:MAG TPA: NUDIX hydrolase [Dictyobacter sp.]|jgi:8-oxo-dGTP pyrophosphatase MutT (NUDIX family)|nr:NUDIX hydrolase [Dictyobacter sp.]